MLNLPAKHLQLHIGQCQILHLFPRLQGKFCIKHCGIMTPDVQWAICSTWLPPDRERKNLSVKTVTCQIFIWVPKNGSLHVAISPVFVFPDPHIGDVWCTLGINSDLSTPLSQTTNNNISADSCPQRFSRGLNLSESPKQHPMAQLEVLHEYKLRVKDSKCGLK